MLDRCRLQPLRHRVEPTSEYDVLPGRAMRMCWPAKTTLEYGSPIFLSLIGHGIA
jgi:hypothetical protein